MIFLRNEFSSLSRLGLDLLFVGQVGYDIIIPGDNASVELIGDHGYDNQASSMHPIFYAMGPAFRRNFLAEPFRSVDIYPLMSHILRLNERKTNGSFENVKDLLQHPNPFDDLISKLGWTSKHSSSKFLFIVVLLLLLAMLCILTVILFGMIYTIFACRHCRQLIYITEPIRYRLLSNTERVPVDFLASESENENEIR